jgi:hypothetical protein
MIITLQSIHQYHPLHRVQNLLNKIELLLSDGYIKSDN